MAEENVPAPTRTDERLVLVKARLPIGKSNLLMDLQKMQKNLIFPEVPSIFIQQFWNILGKDTKTRVFSFQLDELWFNLNVDLLHNALGITPKDSAHLFEAPLASDLVIDFVNNLGYLEELHFVSKMYVNNLYQPWRTILDMINQCLTGKTSGSDKPRHSVLQMLWGIVTRTNVDYAELIWEVFIQAIKNFFSDMANIKVPTKKPKPHVIPCSRFTKLIIYYLGGGEHNIYRKPQSPVHITANDYPFNNLKFINKGEVDEVGKKKKAPEAGKSKQPAPAKQHKPAKKKTSKPTPSKKIHKEKRSDHLVDEADDEPQPDSEPQVEDDEYNL
ncbi:hypothetical protein Tco_0269608 [Tanacetum coccineum]